MEDFVTTSGASTSNIEGTAAARASLLDIPDTAMAGMRAGCSVRCGRAGHRLCLQRGSGEERDLH